MENESGIRKIGFSRPVIHEWDNTPCGHHSGLSATDQRLPKEQIEEIVEGAK